MDVDIIIQGDCLVELSKIPAESVDLICADPPYNLSKGGTWRLDDRTRPSGMGGAWNKTMQTWDNFSFNDYLTFSRRWLEEAKRILKPSGSLWIFGTYHNMGTINMTCQMLGVEIINEVIWYKRNAFPNLAGRRLTASHENILWCHTGGKKRTYYFDYDYAKNGDFAYDGLKSPGKQMRTVWDISNNKKTAELSCGRHPTQKPLRLLDRMIRLTTRPGALVVAPFAGSGSECVAAKMADRHYLGIECHAAYCEMARRRLAAAGGEA